MTSSEDEVIRAKRGLLHVDRLRRADPRGRSYLQVAKAAAMSRRTRETRARRRIRSARPRVPRFPGVRVLIT
jgi:hypothetical protein